MQLWIGRVLSTLAVLFLVFDAVIKLLEIRPVTDSLAHLGYPPHAAPAIGALALACLALHLVPRTAILGAVLVTGYLGGATASQVRIGEPLFSHVLFPTYIAALLWGGLWLRDRRVRGLL